MIRSKNAGTSMLTFDIVARDEDAYHDITVSESLSAPAIATLYGIAPADVAIHAAPTVLAIKITIPRAHSTGAVADRDVYGCQQAGPIAELQI